MQDKQANGHQNHWYPSDPPILLYSIHSVSSDWRVFTIQYRTLGPALLHAPFVVKICDNYSLLMRFFCLVLALTWRCTFRWVRALRRC